MKVLLLGAKGQLAQDLLRAVPAGVSVTALSRGQLDVRDTAALDRAIAESAAHWVVNCSAFAQVDAAETARAEAFAVNAIAVEQMARSCREHEAALLHFSTDYVFDGEIEGYYAEDDAPRPLNVYGESKLAGEQALQRSGARYLLIRTQWLFGTRGRSFVGLMCERATARQPTRVVADEIGCCTYTVDLARAAWQLIDEAEGILHVANRGKVSRYTLAERIFEHFGARSLLSPCTAQEFGSTTRRPDNSALSVRRAEAILGREMPPWHDALDRYLAERAN